MSTVEGSTGTTSKIDKNASEKSSVAIEVVPTNPDERSRERASTSYWCLASGTLTHTCSRGSSVDPRDWTVEIEHRANVNQLRCTYTKGKRFSR